MEDNQNEAKDFLDGLLGLMVFAGVMLLVCSLPAGLVCSLQFRYQHQWSWSILGAGVLAAAMALVGSAMWLTSEFFLKRRWSRRVRNASEAVPPTDE